MHIFIAANRVHLFLSQKRQTCSHDPEEGYMEFVLHRFRELTTVSRRRQGVQDAASSMD
jgi:hypothetical protein